MANVYIEARPLGLWEGSPVDDYIVEDQAGSVLFAAISQFEAIAWARKENHNPLVPRVRYRNDRENPDHWRPAEDSRSRE